MFVCRPSCSIPDFSDGSKEPCSGEKPKPWRELRNLAGLLSAGAAGVKEKGWLEEIL